MRETLAQEGRCRPGVGSRVVDAVDHDHLVGDPAAGDLCILRGRPHHVVERVAPIEGHQHVAQLRTRGVQ